MVGFKLSELQLIFKKYCSDDVPEHLRFSRIDISKDYKAIILEKKIELQVIRVEVEVSGVIRNIEAKLTTIAWLLLVLGLPFFGFPTLYFYLKMLFDRKHAIASIVDQVRYIITALSSDDAILLEKIIQRDMIDYSSEPPLKTKTNERMFFNKFESIVAKTKFFIASMDVRSVVMLMVLFFYVSYSLFLWMGYAINNQNRYDIFGNFRNTCADGTKIGTCSNSKPFFCDEYLNLVPKSEECGCIPGTLPFRHTCYLMCPGNGSLESYCSSDVNYMCFNGTQMFLRDLCLKD